MEQRDVPDSLLSALSTYEVVFFSFSLIILTFLFCYGGVNKSPKEFSNELKTNNKRRQYGQFPESWNRNVTESQDEFSDSSKSLTDSNGFPRTGSGDSSSSRASSSASGSPRSMSEDFIPSHVERSRLKNGISVLKTIKSAFVNAPSLILGGHDKNASEDLTGNENDVFMGLDGGTPKAKEDEDKFVNINAHASPTIADPIVIDSSEVIKQGKMYTLGARKRDEKPPSVKERDFTMTGYYLFYFDMYSSKREFALRNATLEKHYVNATSGAVAGKPFYAIGMDQGGQHLLVGTADEWYRDEWYDALTAQIAYIRKLEIETDGEEEEYRRKGLPSKSELALLNPVVVNKTLDSIQNFSENIIRLRFRSNTSENVSIGNSSIRTKVNSGAVVNPLHPCD